MQLQDKLYQLRKKHNMSQLELAEALDVSRQAISKWEMGTAVPTIENMLLISKLFGVSVDYLINDEMTSEFDAPVVKATAAYYKLNYKVMLVRTIIISVIVVGAIAVGIMTKSVATVSLFLLLTGTCIIVFLFIRCLYRFVTYKLNSTKER